MHFEMIWLIPLLFLLGFLTVLFPLFAAFVYLFWRRPVALPFLAPETLEVLIPAFNEAATIEKTLNSVVDSWKEMERLGRPCRVKVVIGLDGSVDQTPRMVKNFVELISPSGLSIEVRHRTANQGKWMTLVELVSQSQGRWSVLLDSGTLWPLDFLSQIVNELETSACVGIAPGYLNLWGSPFSRLIWLQERLLKSLENLAGGPVSLHGATMVFRTEALKQAVRKLNRRTWLNDDVVLALVLRQIGRVHYLGSSLAVNDCGVKQGVSELGRRRRILIGNIEWIRELYFSNLLGMLKQNPAVALLCGRRVCRGLWAYFLLFSTFSGGMFIGLGILGSGALVIAVLALAGLNRSLREAGLVSLSVPFLISGKNASPKWL